jgi:DNA-directed RNA polymerase subunit N (RpoN/RPB10)
MIIPIKCVTCGNVLADKYRYYVEQVRKKKMEEQSQTKTSDGSKSINKVIYYTKDMANKETPEAEVLNYLKLTNVCCRRVMMTHVDVE